MPQTWYSQVLTETSGTNTSHSERATLDFTTTETGDYLIFIQGMAAVTSTSYSVFVRGQLDNTTTIMEHAKENTNATRTNDYFNFTNFYLASSLAAGSHYVDIDSYVESGGTWYMKNMRIVVIRMDNWLTTSGMYGYVATEASLAISAAAGSPTTLQTLNITPDSTGDYLILGTCELYANSASASAYVRLNITAGTEYLPIDSGYGSTAYEYCGMEDQDTSDRHTLTWGGVVSLTSGASRAILIEGYRTSTNSAAALKRRIIAIRLAAASPLVQSNEATTETTGITITAYSSASYKAQLSWTPGYTRNWTIMGGMNFYNQAAVSSASRLAHISGTTGVDSGVVNESIKRNKQTGTTTTDSWPVFAVENIELVSGVAQIFQMQYTNIAAATMRVKGGWIIAFPDGGQELSTTKTATARIKSEMSTTKSASATIVARLSTTKSAGATIELPTVTYSTTKTSTARIKTVGVSTTKTSTVRIKTAGASTTKSSTARIKHVGVSTTQSSTARIIAEASTTKTSTARIKRLGLSTTKTAGATVVKVGFTTKTADAKIKSVVSTTKTSIARIKTLGQSTTKSSTARIVIVSSTTKSSTARIKTELSTTKTSTARIKTELSTTKSVAARIKRLAQSTTKTVAVRIKQVAQSTTKSSVARIKRTAQSTTKASTAFIIQRNSTTKASAARIKSLGLSTTKSAGAKVSSSKYQNMQSDVRVKVLGLSTTQTAAARIKWINQSTTKTATALVIVVQSTTKTSTARIKSVAQSTTKTAASRIKAILFLSKTTTARIYSVGLSTTKTAATTVVYRYSVEKTAGANILPAIGMTLQAGARIIGRSWVEYYTTIAKIPIPTATITLDMECYGIIEKINIPSVTIVEVKRN